MLSTTYWITARFCHKVRRHPDALPIPWAVRVPSITHARELLDALEQEGVHSGEAVVASDGKVYVRWAD
jgi:hypothetical protein